MSEIDLPLGSIFHLCPDKAKGKCPVRFCKRPSRAHGRLCGTHHVAAWRKRNPVKAAWKNLKDHAKARKLDFNIPFETFVELCEKTGYMEGKGHKPEDLAIDRIENWKGYVIGNIRVVTVEVNGRKGYHEGRIKLKGGQTVMWEVIGIDAHLREKEERRQSYNPYPKQEDPDEPPPPEDQDELPGWLRDDVDEPF